MQEIKVIIAGHIDHGKSTLIGRILHDTNSITTDKLREIREICDSLGKEFEYGYITDSLEEERKQGITIDTTQVSFSHKNRKYTFIDAPGHFEFESNMITGASQADAAVLIVDTSEGIKGQTIKHAYIIGMLGIKSIIVVFNKMDLTGYDEKKFTGLKNKIESLLNRLQIEPFCIIPASSKNGDMIVNRFNNMEWYNGYTVLEALDSLKSGTRDENNRLCFPVQDIYQNIVVGRVESGILERGAEVVIIPGEKTAIIKSIEEFGEKNVLKALQGKAAGITFKNGVSVKRGDIICLKESPAEKSKKILAHIIWMDNVPLKKGDKIRFKCLTQKSSCEITDILRVLDSTVLEERENKKEVNFRETADVIIETEKVIAAEPFSSSQVLGKFVLEKTDICCGGIIKEVY